MKVDFHAANCGPVCKCGEGVLGRQSLEELEFTRSACAAAMNGQVYKLEQLLSRGSGLHGDGTPTDSSGYTPLHYAAQAGPDNSLLERLMDTAAANSDDGDDAGDSAANSDGDTPLHLAALGGHLAACELLDRRGAYAGAANNGGCTPLLMASAGGHLAVAKWVLAAYPAMLDQPDSDGATPLEMAAAHGHAEVAEWLLASGAKPTQRAEAAAADKKIAKTLKRARRNAE